ncbi:hypothetical protein N9S69_04265 [Flavobacteriaceae bacterium]|jgi:hypothetical protein|nr:hypothetical protein [Flavobacteriaceae bacterium]MDG1423689.1 hypothetical protein [Flavobacteriaceae bacterium]
MSDKSSWTLFVVSLFSLGYGVVAYGSSEIFLRPVEQAFICICIAIFLIINVFLWKHNFFRRNDQ